MKINVLSPVNGSVVSASATDISFGNVHRGEHSDSVALIDLKKTTENNILGINMYLQDDGGLTGSQFGYYMNSDFYPGIDHNGAIIGGVTGGLTGASATGFTGGITGISGYTGGVPTGYTGGTYQGLTGGYTGGIFNHFVLNPGATGPGGASVGVTGGNPSQHIWLDVQIGLSGPNGAAQANYRFVYDFN